MRMKNRYEICGKEKDVTTYFDAWDGVRVVHDANVGNRGRETVLCEEHDIFLHCKEYEDGLVKALQITDLGESIRYGDALQERLLEEMKQKWQLQK